MYIEIGIGSKIVTSKYPMDIDNCIIELKLNDTHIIVEENAIAVITDKSNGVWVLKSRFKK